MVRGAVQKPKTKTDSRVRRLRHEVVIQEPRHNVISIRLPMQRKNHTTLIITSRPTVNLMCASTSNVLHLPILNS